MNETVCIKKIKRENAINVDNDFINNENLSWKAKGILLYLLSLSEDCSIYQNEIKNHAADGLCSLRAGLTELKENGYLRVTQLRNSKNQFSGFLYEIDERGLLLADL